MIVVYHSIRSLTESRHSGLFEAYARLAPLVVVDPLNVRASRSKEGPRPGGSDLPAIETCGLYHARMRWLLPVDRLKAVSRYHRWIGMLEILRAVRRRTKGRPVILVVQHPKLLPTLRALPADLFVYEVRDDYVALAVNERERRENVLGHRRLLRSADLVVAISDQLVEDIKPVRPDVQLTSVGVEREFFLAPDESSIPAALRAIREPRIGTLGNLNDRTDWELLEFLARSRPAWNIVVIGPLHAPGPLTFEGIERLKQLPNVHLLPAVDQAVIPAAIAGLDVCLIPYRISTAVERINPLKLYQYLAVGKPVVSTAIPSVKPFADVVGWTTTRDEFLAATDRALETATDPQRREARQAVARRFTWDAVAEHQLELFRRALERKSRKNR
jgi:glycosyltransferase involved in cell wall biosynthesis